jgi:hypothetical protein
MGIPSKRDRSNSERLASMAVPLYLMPNTTAAKSSAKTKNATPARVSKT